MGVGAEAVAGGLCDKGVPTSGDVPCGRAAGRWGTADAPGR